MMVIGIIELNMKEKRMQPKEMIFSAIINKPNLNNLAYCLEFMIQ